MSLGIGMCISQTRAVLEGLFQRTGEFLRTPKRVDAPPVKRYRIALRGLPAVERVFATWFAWALVAAVQKEMWGSLPFLLLFFSGFLWVGFLSVRDWARSRA